MDLVQVNVLGLLRWGFGGPNHASLSLESSQHIYKFLPKYLTWSDNDNNLYLGPLVEDQQVLDPSPQTGQPQKRRKWGGAHLPQQILPVSISQGLRFMPTSSGCLVRSILLLLLKIIMFTCIFCLSR